MDGSNAKLTAIGLRKALSELQDMLKAPEILTSVAAAAGAVSQVAAGNAGGMVLAFLLIAVLAWRQWLCERGRKEAQDENSALKIALTALHGVTCRIAENQRRKIQVPELSELLSGKPELLAKFRYEPDPDPPEAPRRRTGDRHG